MRSILAISILASSGLAAAEPTSITSATKAEPYSLGVRVGGYGFKREGDGSATSWTECRMNGVGVFVNHTVRAPLFLEAGLDAYTSTNMLTNGAENDLPIDRQSMLLSMAAGVRTSFTSWLDGYAQLGAGIELARVAVPYGGSTIRDDKVMPDGFFGFGADIKITKATRIGASLRTLVMGNFNYDPMRLQNANQWVAAPAPSDVFSASPGLAAQGQFYLRHDL
jgi:hypothetical protein